jgi:hypothetical protein
LDMDEVYAELDALILLMLRYSRALWFCQTHGRSRKSTDDATGGSGADLIPINTRWWVESGFKGSNQKCLSFATFDCSENHDSFTITRMTARDLSGSQAFGGLLRLVYLLRRLCCQL